MSGDINDSLYTTEDEEYPVELISQPHVSEKITAVCLLTVFVLSVVGNSLLVSALVCLEDLRRVSNLYFLCLASFDLLFTLTLPFWAVYLLHHWVFGDIACKLLIGAYFVGQYGSLVLLTAMALDRFCTVVLKGRYTARPGRRLRCARLVCVATWGVSVAMSLREALVSVHSSSNGTHSCEDGQSGGLDDNVWSYMQIVFLFLLPLVIIVFCYSCIFRTVLSVPNMRDRYGSVVLLFSIVTAFFICWGPYNLVLYLLTVLDQSESIMLAYGICRVLAYSHCCINPLLYMLRPRYRNLLCRLVHCSENASQPNSHAIEMQRGPESAMCVEMTLME
ncbi:C-C chemokine receptor type 5 [Sardina pilchardus]|uniref:C-C chemokine receptor type 5 n=1 Tax=Sardina pilchardus TaxID=27697 RepID=UPI002E1662F6